jgi:hypothetical protein
MNVQQDQTMSKPNTDFSPSRFCRANSTRTFATPAEELDRFAPSQRPWAGG